MGIRRSVAIYKSSKSMGGLIAKALDRLTFGGHQQSRILMVGLDAAGKTSILYKLKLDELVQTIPTIGFNVESVQYKNIDFTIWDVGGQDKIRKLWRHYFTGSDAVIYVVDSNDRERIEEAKEELMAILSDDELLASCVLLLVAGNETTTKLITNGVLQLARHPEQRELLVENPELLPGAVEELLRFDGTVQSTFRVVTKEAEVEGVTLSPGTMVLVMVAAANRDPDHFEKPEEFDVTRSNAREHLGLGFGVHYCLGASLGRLETRAALEALLGTAPEYQVVNDELRYGPNYFLRGLEQLAITR